MLMSRKCCRCHVQIPGSVEALGCEECKEFLCPTCRKEGLFQKVRSFTAIARSEKAATEFQMMWEIVESALQASFALNSDMYALFSLVDDGQGYVHAKNFVKHMGR